MVCHALYPALDPVHNATVSSTILQQLLRQNVGFARGIAISDAMWMGPYGTLPTARLHRVYLQVFVAGMDMLMIPGGRYRGARDYFRRVLADEVDASERTALREQFSGLDFAASGFALAR